MAELLETEVVNVPTYDGSQAAATALRMACRITGRDEVLVSAATNPDRLRMIRNYLRPDVKVTLFGFDAATWYRLARNSFEASFATDAEKAGWIARLDAYFAAAGVPPG